MPDLRWSRGAVAGSILPLAAPSTWTRERVIWLAISLSAALLPFTLVTFPPAADLAQHAAQIRLLDEQLGLAPETTPREQYEVRWWAPNSLVYAVLFATSRVLAPIPAARTALALLALLLVLAIHDLARRRGRPPEHAALASTLVFSLSLYWGFVAFLLGAALFLLSLERALAPPDPAHRARDVAVLGALTTLVYAAHALWLPALALAVALAPLVERRPIRPELPRALAFAPPLLHALIWFPRLTAERAETFELAARWAPWSERVAPGWWVDALYGGLRGTMEPAVAAIVIGWALLGLALPRERDERGGIDVGLLTLGAVLLAFIAVAPDSYMNTVAFGRRFGFVAGALVLLAAPRPPLRPVLSRALSGAVVGFFALTTAAAWVVVDREELSGLAESTRVAPGPARVVGLDFLQASQVLDGVPFLQEFAWRQALYGGELNFSFAEHRTCIVGVRETPRHPWTQSLETMAQRVTPRDLTYFDLALVAGSDELHARFAAQTGAEPLVRRGRFRLYRLRHPGDAPHRAAGGAAVTE